MRLQGFTEARHVVGDADNHFAAKGAGPPVLLLHASRRRMSAGMMWRRAWPAITPWWRQTCAGTARRWRPPAGRAAKASASASFHIARGHDAEDREAGRRITAPLLLVSGEEEAQLANAPAIWRVWAHDVTATEVPRGHVLPEEAPRELTTALAAFLGPRASMNAAAAGVRGWTACRPPSVAQRPMISTNQFCRGR